MRRQPYWELKLLVLMTSKFHVPPYLQMIDLHIASVLLLAVIRCMRNILDTRIGADGRATAEESKAFATANNLIVSKQGSMSTLAARNDARLGMRSVDKILGSAGKWRNRRTKVAGVPPGVFFSSLIKEESP